MMKLAPYWSESALVDEIMTHAPLTEPIRLSLTRLERAILFDERRSATGFEEPEDPAPVFSPARVWTAYMRHPELMMTYEQSKKEFNARRRDKDRV